MTGGPFIALEGIDGSGKTTHVDRLAAHIRRLGREVVTVEEPGGTDVGDRLRELILNARGMLAPLSELLMIEASRHELVRQVIRPALERDAVVIAHRYAYSSVAYQGYGRGLDIDLIRRLNAEATQDIRPDLALWLDLPAETAWERLQGARTPDRLEGEGSTFLRRVADGYWALAQECPEMVRIDANQPVDDLFQDLLEAIDHETALPVASGEGGFDGISV